MTSSLQIISPDDLELYSSCSKKYFFVKQQVIQKSSFKTILEEEIYAAYLDLLRFKQHTSWGTFTRRLDRKIYSQANLESTETFNQVSKLSLLARSRVNSFFHSVYLNEHRQIYAGINFQTGHRQLLFQGNILLLTLDTKEGLGIIIFSNEDLSVSQIKQRLKYRALIWLTYRRLNHLPNTLEIVYIPTDSNKKIEYSILKISKKEIKSFTNDTEKAIIHLLDGIQDKVFYPNPGLHCNQCDFKSICGW